MNRIYEPHKSSILDLDANLVSVILYAIPIISTVFSSLSTLVWVLPLVVFILEKNSPLVKFHAAQCLTIQILVSIINLVLGIFASLSAGASLLIGFNIFAAFGTLGITGIVMGLISLGVFVMQIVAMTKAYAWISYRLPVFGDFANIFVKE